MLKIKILLLLVLAAFIMSFRTTQAAMTPLAIEMRVEDDDMSKAIFFRLPPAIYSTSSGDLYSISAWIRPATLPTTVSYNIAALDSGNQGGFRFYVLPGGKLGCYSNVFNVAPGTWETTTAPISAGT